jgi:signal peptidase I
MENLKNKFNNLNEKYLNKKSFFKNKIEIFWKKGQLELHKKGVALLDEADSLSSLISESLNVTSEGQSNKKVLNNKIKSFQKCLKLLTEITKPVWRQWVEAILVAGSLVFVLRTYIFGLYHVPTGSAEPTILVGDRIWGNKMSYYLGTVKHGDSVIFDNPEFAFDRSSNVNYFWQKYVGFPIPVLDLPGGPDNWVKRVIAIPGDVLEGRVEDGKTVIYRNGIKLDETAYVNPYPIIGLKKTTGFIPFSSFGLFPVPDFLRKITKDVFYTYDQTKTFENQPFYNMSSNEVIRRADYTPILKKPYSPSYDYDFIRGFSSTSVDEFGPIRIPDGKYWVMGDSRKNSKDSRFWGFLDESLIHGKASFIIYSVDSEEPLWIFELIKHPINFWFKSIRWNRFLKWIK